MSYRPFSDTEIQYSKRDQCITAGSVHRSRGRSPGRLLHDKVGCQFDLVAAQIGAVGTVGGDAPRSHSLLRKNYRHRTNDVAPLHSSISTSRFLSACWYGLKSRSPASDAVAVAHLLGPTLWNLQHLFAAQSEDKGMYIIQLQTKTMTLGLFVRLALQRPMQASASSHLHCMYTSRPNCT